MAPGSTQPFIFNWSRGDISCVSFRLQYSDSTVIYIMSAHQVRLVPICHHTKLLQYYWLYSLCCTSLRIIYLCCNWKFVPLNPLHLFLRSPHQRPPPLAATSLFSKFLSLFLFLSLCFSCCLYVHLNTEKLYFPIWLSLSYDKTADQWNLKKKKKSAICSIFNFNFSFIFFQLFL